MIWMAKNPKPHELRDRAFRVEQNLERASTPRRLLPERHLFVTEGTKTEPNYLSGIVALICNRYGPDAKKQFAIMGEGDNTLNLLQRAEAYQQNDADGYQHVWIIYDQDDFPPDSFDNVAKRCDALNKRFQGEGRDTTFHAIWSNQCIELWFLLHFDYMHADITREQYREILSDRIGRHYEKADEAVFELLLPKMETAIKNAKKLMKEYGPELPPSQRAPATNVYELVEHLKGYMK